MFGIVVDIGDPKGVESRAAPPDQEDPDENRSYSRPVLDDVAASTLAATSGSRLSLTQG